MTESLITAEFLAVHSYNFHSVLQDIHLQGVDIQVRQPKTVKQVETILFKCGPIYGANKFR